MAHGTLENLKSDEFAIKYSFVSNYKAIYKSLQESEETGELYAALRDGEVTEQSLQEFCDELFKSLQQGVRFPHEIAIVAIAVTMEIWQTPFAKEFVVNLGELDLAEMPIATRIAREISGLWEKIERMTPSNEELCKLAERHPPPQEWYDE